MFYNSMPDEREWEARDDARTLARAEAIINDPERHQRAKNAASKVLNDAVERVREERASQNAELRALASVAQKPKNGSYIKPTKRKNGTSVGRNAFPDSVPPIFR